MAYSAKAVVAQALALPINVRLRLVDQLLDSIEMEELEGLEDPEPDDDTCDGTGSGYRALDPPC